MKLTDKIQIQNTIINKFEGKRKIKGQRKWQETFSIIAKNVITKDKVEFMLINDFGQDIVSIYFNDGWDEVRLINEGVINSEEHFRQIVAEAEDSLKEYYRNK